MKIYVIVSLFSSLLKFYLAALICRLFWEQADGPRWRAVLCLGGFVLLSVLAAIPALAPASFYLSCLAVFMVCLYHETQWFWRLFFLPCFLLLLEVAEMLTSLAMSSAMGYTFPQFIQAFQQGNAVIMTDHILSLFLAVFLVKLISVAFKSRELQTYPRLSLLSLALPLGSCVIVFYFSQMMIYVESQWLIDLVLAIYTLLLLGNLFLIEVMERTGRIKRAEQERLAAHEELRQNTEHFRRLILRQDSAAQAMQDIRNQLAAGLGLLREGKTEEACGLLERVSADSSLKESRRVSGNIAIDAVLDTKWTRIREMNIRFTPNITMPPVCAVAHEDLAVVVGNILDNAINACQELLQPESRYIRFTIKQFQEYLCLQVENSAVPEPETQQDSAYPLHGFGLENVRQTAKKYSGNLSIRRDASRFTVTVLLHNREGSAA